MRTPIKVLVVRHDRLMFEGLVSVLSDRSDLEVLGVASTAADALEKCVLLEPDLVLIDTRLPDAAGADACARIRSRAPDVAVLFLSADSSDQSMERAVAAGAAGYMSADASTGDLLDAIRRLADGELLVTTSTIARLLRERQAQPFAGDEPLPQVQLSEAERAVLTRVAASADNFEIAAQLGVKPAQVRGRVRSLLEKLGLHSKAQAVDWARRTGLVGDVAPAAPS